MDFRSSRFGGPRSFGCFLLICLAENGVLLFRSLMIKLRPSHVPSFLHTRPYVSSMPMADALAKMDEEWASMARVRRSSTNSMPILLQYATLFSSALLLLRCCAASSVSDSAFQFMLAFLLLAASVLLSASPSRWAPTLLRLAANSRTLMRISVLLPGLFGAVAANKLSS